jgi:hypothetical protein
MIAEVTQLDFFIYLLSPYAGGLEYFHRSPTRRRRRRKGNPMPEGITGQPCHWGTQIQGPGIPGWDLDARLTPMLSKKKILLRNPKK